MLIQVYGADFSASGLGRIPSDKMLSQIESMYNGLSEEETIRLGNFLYAIGYGEDGSIFSKLSELQIPFTELDDKYSTNFIDGTKIRISSDFRIDKDTRSLEKPTGNNGFYTKEGNKGYFFKAPKNKMFECMFNNNPGYYSSTGTATKNLTDFVKITAAQSAYIRANGEGTLGDIKYVTENAVDTPFNGDTTQQRVRAAALYGLKHPLYVQVFGTTSVELTDTEARTLIKAMKDFTEKE